MVLAGDVLTYQLEKISFTVLYDGNLLNDNRELIRQKQSVRLVGRGESHGAKRVQGEQDTEHYVGPSSEPVLLCMVQSHAAMLLSSTKRSGGLGLKIALSARAAEGKLLVFDDLELPTHKTKNVVSFVNQMEETKKILMVYEEAPIDEKLKRATQNLHYVNVLPSIGLNVYSILLHDTLVMSRGAVNKIVERMHTPINR